MDAGLSLAFTATDDALVYAADLQGSRGRTALFAMNSPGIIQRNQGSRYHGQHFCCDLVWPNRFPAKSRDTAGFARPSTASGKRAFSGVPASVFYSKFGKQTVFSSQKILFSTYRINRFPSDGKVFLPK